MTAHTHTHTHIHTQMYTHHVQASHVYDIMYPSESQSHICTTCLRKPPCDRQTCVHGMQTNQRCSISLICILSQLLIRQGE